jgi:osmoprotectant transport system ATP-binding protein
MINRMVDPTSGAVEIDGEDVMSLKPVQLRRSIGYVMQNSGLLPHRKVVDNIATVPLLRGVNKKIAREGALDLMDKVGLERSMADKYPSQLSGGQQQRVGVARGLAVDPNILLMDEPFGAVDPIVRDELQLELLHLQRELDKTVVFVTHDIDEAVLVGDRICLMQMQARVAQYDTPQVILTRPASDYVAEFLGRERLVRRMSVVAIDPHTLEHPSAGPRPGEPHVPVSSSLTEAFAAALTSPTEAAAVFDQDRYVGTFTATSLLESLRRAAAVGGDEVATGI